MAAKLEAVRDVPILHFHVTERRETAYWRRLVDMPIPESLAERIAICRRAGRKSSEAKGLSTRTSRLR